MGRIVRDERGVALVTALIALVIVSLLGAAALTVAGGTLNQTMWDRSTGQAFHVAEAGFDQAVARIKNGNPTEGTFYPKFSTGEASVTVTKLGAYVYQVKSVGAQPSLASPKARRAVQGIITYVDPASMSYADACQGTVLGSTTFDGPLYVRDKLDGSGNAHFNVGPFFVKDDPATLNPTGDLDLGGSGTMGSAGQPVALFIDGIQPYSTAGPQLFAQAVYTDVPDLTMPIVDVAAMPAKRADADVVLDNGSDTVTNGNRPVLEFNKNTPDTLFGTYPGGAYLKWTQATYTLEVNGKIYLDGPLTIGGTGSDKINKVTYSGRGTITAYGNIRILCSFTPSPAPPGAGTPFPNTSAFGLVTPLTIDASAQNGDTVAAILYAYAQVTISKPIEFYGSVTSRALNFSSNPHIHVEPLLNQSNLPPGLPRMDPMTAVSGWQEVRP